MEKVQNFTTSCSKGYLYCVRKADTGLVSSQGAVRAASMTPPIYDEILYMEQYNPEDAAENLNKKHNPKSKIKASEIIDILTHARNTSPDIMFFKERPRPVGQKVYEDLYERSQDKVSALQEEIDALKAAAKKPKVQEERRK